MSCAEDFGQPALACLLVQRRDVVSCLFHHVYDFVERHAVSAVREGRVQVGVECARGREGVAFYARYLYEAAYGVACHAELVFKPHLGGILYLRRAASEQLARRCGSHRAGHSHFALASHVGSRDGCVLLHYVAYQAGSGYMACSMRESLNWCPRDRW